MKMAVFIIKKTLVPKSIFLCDMKLVCAKLGFIGYNLIKLYEADFWSLKMLDVPQQKEHHVSRVFIFLSFTGPL